MSNSKDKSHGGKDGVCADCGVKCIPHSDSHDICFRCLPASHFLWPSRSQNPCTSCRSLSRRRYRDYYQFYETVYHKANDSYIQPGQIAPSSDESMVEIEIQEPHPDSVNILDHDKLPLDTEISGSPSKVVREPVGQVSVHDGSLLRSPVEDRSRSFKRETLSRAPVEEGFSSPLGSKFRDPVGNRSRSLYSRSPSRDPVERRFRDGTQQGALSSSIRDPVGSSSPVKGHPELSRSPVGKLGLSLQVGPSHGDIVSVQNLRQNVTLYDKVNGPQDIVTHLKKGPVSSSPLAGVVLGDHHVRDRPKSVVKIDRSSYSSGGVKSSGVSRRSSSHSPKRKRSRFDFDAYANELLDQTLEYSGCHLL